MRKGVTLKVQKAMSSHTVNHTAIKNLTIVKTPCMIQGCCKLDLEMCPEC